MNLYYLERKDACGYDESLGFVVRAETPRHARELCSKQAGDEGAAAWLSTTRTSCRHLDDAGSPKIILRSFNAG